MNKYSLFIVGYLSVLCAIYGERETFGRYACMLHIYIFKDVIVTLIYVITICTFLLQDTDIFSVNHIRNCLTLAKHYACAMRMLCLVDNSSFTFTFF